MTFKDELRATMNKVVRLGGSRLLEFGEFFQYPLHGYSDIPGKNLLKSPFSCMGVQT